MSLLTDRLLLDVEEINHSLDDLDYGLYGPEPERATNYKVGNRHIAVVQDHSSYDVILLFKDGKIDDMQEVPF